MKNIFLAIAVFAISLSCKAQSTISLEQAYEYSKTPDGIPETVTYVKDTNNRLDQFVGTWVGTYDGKKYEIQFIKKNNFGENIVKWDKIIGKMVIKNLSGYKIYDDTTLSDLNANLFGLNFQNRSYMMGFVANAACNDSGDVFIEISKNNPNIMYLNFDRDTGIYNPAKCPNYSSYVPLLPKDKMTLAKQ